MATKATNMSKMVKSQSRQSQSQLHAVISQPDSSNSSPSHPTNGHSYKHSQSATSTPADKNGHDTAASPTAANTPHPDHHNEPLRKRQRTRRACEPCRKRKRKCDGKEPCAYCVGYDYRCWYDDSLKRKRGVLPMVGDDDDHHHGTDPAEGADDEMNDDSHSEDETRDSKTAAADILLAADGGEAHIPRRLGSPDGTADDGKKESLKRKRGSMAKHREASEEPTDDAGNIPPGLLLKFGADKAGALGGKSAKTIQQQQGIYEPNTSRYIAASSAIAFPRLLALEMNAADPPKLQSYAWNVGIRHDIAQPRVVETNIRELMSFDDCKKYTDIYFKTYHVVFGFLDKAEFVQRSKEVWESTAHPRTDLQALVFNLCALGSLFAKKGHSHALEQRWIEESKKILENTSMVDTSSLDHVSAWILRTLYLRATTRPHTSWMSSCICLHVVEAIGLHRDPSTLSLSSSRNYSHLPSKNRAEQWRRTFWVASSINRLIAYEYSRSRVVVAGANCKLPNQETRDLAYRATNEVINMANSIVPDDCLPADPEQQRAVLEKTMGEFLSYDARSSFLVAFRANISFAMFRRLRLLRHNFDPALVALLLSYSKKVLAHIGILARDDRPYPNLISTPFNLLIILLALDTAPSIALLPHAYQCLGDMSRSTNTTMAREASRTARYLIKCLEIKKKKDLTLLENIPACDGIVGGPDSALPPFMQAKTLEANDPASKQAEGEQPELHQSGQQRQPLPHHQMQPQQAEARQQQQQQQLQQIQQLQQGQAQGQDQQQAVGMSQQQAFLSEQLRQAASGINMDPFHELSGMPGSGTLDGQATVAYTNPSPLSHLEVSQIPLWDDMGDVEFDNIDFAAVAKAIEQETAARNVNAFGYSSQSPSSSSLILGSEDQQQGQQGQQQGQSNQTAADYQWQQLTGTAPGGLFDWDWARMGGAFRPASAMNGLVNMAPSTTTIPGPLSGVNRVQDRSGTNIPNGVLANGTGAGVVTSTAPSARTLNNQINSSALGHIRPTHTNSMPLPQTNSGSL